MGMVWHKAPSYLNLGLPKEQVDHMFDQCHLILIERVFVLFPYDEWATTELLCHNEIWCLQMPLCLLRHVTEHTIIFRIIPLAFVKSFVHFLHCLT